MDLLFLFFQVMNAMKFVFGPYMVCDTPETAKQITFHPNVRVKTVTKEGDLYDPAGTITGGSAPKGGNTLMKLQELFGSSGGWVLFSFLHFVVFLFFLAAGWFAVWIGGRVLRISFTRNDVSTRRHGMLPSL